MYILKRIESENILFFSLKGIVTEDQGTRAVQELNSTVRHLEKGYNLIVDVRRFKPSSYDNAVSITKSAIKLMSIKRPALIIRSGPKEILKLLDKAYIELSIPINFTLLDSEEYSDILARLDENKAENQRLSEWIKKNIDILNEGNKAPGDLLENDVDITSFSMSGVAIEKKAVSFSATVFSHKGKKPFYRFSYCKDMVGSMGTQAQWSLMPDGETSAIGKCDFVFDNPGRYIVSIKASTELGNWNTPEIPEVRMAVFVRPDEESSDAGKASSAYLNDFPFSAGSKIEVIYNRESMNPVMRQSTIYECDLTAQSMVIDYVDAESEYGLRFDSIDITVPYRDESGKAMRKGVTVISNRRISNYPISEQHVCEAMLARFTLPVELIGLRCDRQFYRCECAALPKLVDAEVTINGQSFISGQDFTISDLSLTGVGLKFIDTSPFFSIIKSNTEVFDKGEIKFMFHDPSSPDEEPRIVDADIQVMRKNICQGESVCRIGIRFTDIGVKEGAKLNQIITILQLEEKNTQ